MRHYLNVIPNWLKWQNCVCVEWCNGNNCNLVNEKMNKNEFCSCSSCSTSIDLARLICARPHLSSMPRLPRLGGPLDLVWHANHFAGFHLLYGFANIDNWDNSEIHPSAVQTSLIELVCARPEALGQRRVTTKITQPIMGYYYSTSGLACVIEKASTRQVNNHLVRLNSNVFSIALLSDVETPLAPCAIATARPRKLDNLVGQRAPDQRHCMFIHSSLESCRYNLF